MIMDKDSRDILPFDFFIQSLIGIREARTCALYDQALNTCLQEIFKEHGFFIEMIFCNGYIDLKTLFLHDRFYSGIDLRKQIICKIAQNQTYMRFFNPLMFHISMVGNVGSAAADPFYEPFLFHFVKGHTNSLPGIAKLLFQYMLGHEFVAVFDDATHDKRTTPFIQFLIF